MTFASNDTITAVATAPGRGGVGIVRVSGPQCRAMAEAILGLTPKPRYAQLWSVLRGERRGVGRRHSRCFSGTELLYR